MTVDGTGSVHGVSVGSATITAFFGNVPVYTGQYCGGNGCPTASPAPGAPAKVTPTILLGGSNGTDITNTTQSVVVGQQIVLYGKYTLPSDYTFTSQSWTIPGTGSTPPTAISNFTYASDFSSGGPVALTSTQLGQQTVTFYFVAAGNSQQVTFTLKYKDNQSQDQTAPATATFNVAGPSNPNVITCGGNVPNGNCPNGTNGPLGQVVINPGTPPTVGLGNSTFSNAGIVFNASATPPSGYSNNFIWVHLITANTIAIAGTPNVTCHQITNPQNTTGTGLDTDYPFGTGASVNDNPDFPLETNYQGQVTNVTEVNDSPFSATMYLMWSPGPAPSIPVPLGSVTWQWSGDATYNSSSQTWSLKSGSGSANAFASSNSYPSWTSQVPFSGAVCN